MVQTNSCSTTTTSNTSSTSATKPKRQRNRTPKSCIQCSKRKIFCSKERPACSNCIKYSVGHLCSYALPPWADASANNNNNNNNNIINNNNNNNNNNITNKASANATKPNSPRCSLVEQPLSPIRILQSDEYRQLKQSNEKVIQAQRKEIDDLKRQLSVQQQLSPRDTTTKQQQQQQQLSNSGNIPITVLNKISPLANTYNGSKIEMLNDYTLCTIDNSSSGSKNIYVDTYSWINIIKLDPQLTTLWFRITNLQKMYHVYKMNMLKGGQSTDNVIKKVSKKSNYKINEIDFTYSLQPTTPSDSNKEQRQQQQQQQQPLRCPVVECDFNFMSEEQQFTTPSPMRSVSVSPAVKLERSATIIEKSTASELQQKLIGLWESLISLPRGESKLNIQQIHFLLDYYYKSDIESKDILSFYRFDIQAVFKKTANDEVVLNLPQNTGSAEFEAQLKSCGIFLCMLVLIVEESLSELRVLFKEATNKELCEQFEDTFPNEVMLLNLGPRQNNLLHNVQEFLIHFESDEYNRSLSYCAVVVALLNREIDDYKKPGSSITDTKNSFTSLYTAFLHLLLDGSLDIWKDPELVEIRSQYKKRRKDLKLHFCHLWASVVRLTNLVTLNFVPLVKHSEYLDGLLRRIYRKIQEVDSLQYHLKFLSKLGEDQLIVSLHVHYLIANVSCSLYHGILNLGSNKLVISTLEQLIKQCQTWITDVGVQRFSEARKFEILIILDYLSYFMIYLIMLQGEELGDATMVNNVVPNIFTKLSQLIQSLRVTPKRHAQYLYSIGTEVLTRSVQFVVGLLTRFKDESRDGNLLKEGCTTIFTIKGLLSPTECMDDLSAEIEQIITFLDSVLINKERLTKLVKLWKFYITLSKDLNCSKLHIGFPGFNNGNASACPVLADGGAQSAAVAAATANTCPVSNSSKATAAASGCPVMHHKGVSTASDSMTMSPTSQPIKRETITKCPISSITTPMNDEEINVNQLPPPLQASNHKSPQQQQLQSPMNKKMKKCPFDHGSMMKPNLYPNQVESSIRGSFDTFKTHAPSPLGGGGGYSMNNTPVPMPSSLQSVNMTNVTGEEPSKDVASGIGGGDITGGAPRSSKQSAAGSETSCPVSSAQQVAPPQQQSQLMNGLENLDVFNQFHDFDFDFLNSENILEHFGGSAPGTGAGTNGDLDLGLNNLGNGNIEGFFQ
ncbi:unnamed protein product [Candida parapsilosis]|uniref:Zn(2)-C6 fungal-type domain-containing protein n=2 Tax=Candida parapsilosis TaxID=5480 RepID=G8BHL4_CANPC|nr:uncharacterized protein CPAR2_501640 [Candida parapsilosis]KAF6045069.1 Fungal Zn(2)-Cys(6) binuclear cluster domain family protein [Candida parapsilosis]KAF6048785.1 Fungal Zn(2)-Cys(6) binuclear cluster domain family protein [Candida parapsilosis]KAI5908463.1 hypothetical protein K4G61_g2149 [Candida parapsilosis]CAD1813115.1 unnamed protein product [Candida parapsilosis]CCE43939.1 hypothetical protein CPAR2_501640 [Candida parapsilosis]